MGAGVHIEQAPAKLTLSLRITGVRADGYHLIDAEMVTLDLADTLTFGPGHALTVSCEGPAEAVATRIGTGPDNLVARALRSVARRAAVHVVKRIPPGAGLGGGSADAAAVLRWAGETSAEHAAALGADVPFCVLGGRARVGGIGETVEPLVPARRTFTLALAPFGCATVAVYRAWDRLGGPEGGAGNDLEPAALRVEPRLAAWRDRLGEETGMRPRLAGSGSTWFVEGEFPGPGRVVVRTPG